MNVKLTKAQWDMISADLLDSQQKPLIYLAKEIQVQVVQHDQLEDFKQNLRRQGLNV